jgi:hypothetical protein
MSTRHPRADLAAEEKIRFTSSILPKWARRTKSLDALLPILYLRGVSTGDFQEALAALLGKDAPNLSPAGCASHEGGHGLVVRAAPSCPLGERKPPSQVPLGAPAPQPAKPT